MKSRVIALVFLLAIGQVFGQENETAVPVAANSAAQNNSNATPETEKPNPNENPPANFFFINSAGSAEQNKGDAEAADNAVQQAGIQKSIAHATWAQVLVALLLLVVTILIWRVYGRQEGIMGKQADISTAQKDISERQEKIMEKQADISAAQLKEMHDARDVAMGSAAQSRDTAQRQLRAYISVSLDAGYQARIPRSGTDDFIRLVIKNNGLTPAYEVAAQGYIVSMDEQSKDFKVPPLDLTRKSGKVMLGPNQEISLCCKMEGHLTPVGTITRQLYLLARVEYMDAFNERRFSTVCFVWRDHTLSPAEYGNDGN